MKKRIRMNIMVKHHGMRIGFIILACMLLASFVSTQDLEPSNGGTTYYVSPSGNDDNQGTETQPWLTIQKAANTLVAGDTVYIKAGTYSEQVVPKNSGSAGKYIVYAEYPGDTVTIDGSALSLSSEEDGLFYVSGKSYIKISGLKIANAGPNPNNCGIYVEISSHIIIENNYIYNTVSSGIGVWGSADIIIDGNEVELACNDGEQECITVAGTDTFEVRNNHVHDGGPGTNGGEGIDIKDGSSNGEVFGNHVHHINGERTCIYVDSWDKHTFNIDVYQNLAHDCGAGVSLASEKGGLLENIRIYNNVLYQNRANGLEIGNWGEWGILKRPIENIEFLNNTVYNNGSSEWGGGMHIENPDAKKIVIRNNIFSQNLLFQLSDETHLSEANLTADHNLIDGYRGYDDELYGNDYVEADPLFVDPSGGDFHLQGNSPAIDSGSYLDAPSDDYDGNVRPHGAEYDIGAYEYGSEPVTTTTTVPASATTTTTTAVSDTTTTIEDDDDDEACPAEEIYGVYSEETELLRDYRDSILSKTPEGQKTIEFYYKLSPAIVEVMKRNEKAKVILKTVLDNMLPFIQLQLE